MKIILAAFAMLAQGVAPAAPALTLDRWVISASGFVAPKDTSGNDAIYEVVGVSNTAADAQLTCDLQVDNHGNARDAGAQITMTDPAVPFAVRSGDSLSATGEAGCVLVLTVLGGYPLGSAGASR